MDLPPHADGLASVGDHSPRYLRDWSAGAVGKKLGTLFLSQTHDEVGENFSAWRIISEKARNRLPSDLVRDVAELLYVPHLAGHDG